MSGVLEGTLQGESLKDLNEKAKKVCESYFGTACVDVLLENQRPSIDGESVTFAADFKAIVSHRLISRGYAPDRCSVCGETSWSSAPLPSRRWRR